MVRLIFCARKWKQASTALHLTLGSAILNQNLRNLKVLHSIPDLPTTGNSDASK